MCDPSPGRVSARDVPIGRHPVARTIRAVAITAALLLAASILSDVLLLIFAGILVAAALAGSVDWLVAKTGLGRGAAFALVCLAVIAALAAFTAWVGPQLAEEVPRLWSNLFDQWQGLKAWVEQTPWLQPIVDNLSQSVPGLPSLTGRVLGYASTTLGAFGTAIVILFTGLYLAGDPDLYRRGFLKLLAPVHRPRWDHILSRTGRTLRLWVLGRVIDMAAVAILTFLGLWALGMPLALSLALLAGLLNFVPYIGAVAGAAPALLIALGQGHHEILWVAGLYAVIQSVEGYLLAPAIQSRTVHVAPAVTILSQAVFGTLFGFMGLILAPALAACAQTIIRLAYVEDVLGDETADPDSAGA